MTDRRQTSIFDVLPEPDVTPRGCYDEVVPGTRVRNRLGTVREVVGRRYYPVRATGGRLIYQWWMLRLHDPDEPGHESDRWGQVLRLAKAIDPTCKAEPVEGMPGRHRCSECHAVWQPIEDQHGRYCSECGARREDR